jgi:hypothetical protein
MFEHAGGQSREELIMSMLTEWYTIVVQAIQQHTSFDV